MRPARPERAAGPAHRRPQQRLCRQLLHCQAHAAWKQSNWRWLQWSRQRLPSQPSKPPFRFSCARGSGGERHRQRVCGCRVIIKNEPRGSLFSLPPGYKVLQAPFARVVAFQRVGSVRPLRAGQRATFPRGVVLHAGTRWASRAVISRRCVRDATVAAVCLTVCLSSAVPTCTCAPRRGG